METVMAAMAAGMSLAALGMSMVALIFTAGRKTGKEEREKPTEWEGEGVSREEERLRLGLMELMSYGVEQAAVGRDED